MAHHVKKQDDLGKKTKPDDSENSRTKKLSCVKELEFAVKQNC